MRTQPSSITCSLWLCEIATPSTEQNWGCVRGGRGGSDGHRNPQGFLNQSALISMTYHRFSALNRFSALSLLVACFCFVGGRGGGIEPKAFREWEVGSREVSWVCSGNNREREVSVERTEQPQRSPLSTGFIALCCHLADHWAAGSSCRERLDRTFTLEDLETKFPDRNLAQGHGQSSPASYLKSRYHP